VIDGLQNLMDEVGELRFVVSHPLDRKKSKGWGTEALFLFRLAKSVDVRGLRTGIDGKSRPATGQLLPQGE